MVEFVITGSVIAAAAYVASRRDNIHAAASGTLDVGGDLPCPWCRADTIESDTKCPGCGQVFG